MLISWRKSRSDLRKCRALLAGIEGFYDKLLTCCCKSRSHLRKYRALWREFRALLRECRAFLIGG
jgi:hypothetical protein